MGQGAGSEDRAVGVYIKTCTRVVGRLWDYFFLIWSPVVTEFMLFELVVVDDAVLIGVHLTEVINSSLKLVSGLSMGLTRVRFMVRDRVMPRRHTPPW